MIKVLFFLYTLKVVQGLEKTLMSLHALIDMKKMSILITIKKSVRSFELHTGVKTKVCLLQ